MMKRFLMAVKPTPLAALLFVLLLLLQAAFLSSLEGRFELDNQVVSGFQYAYGLGASVTVATADGTMTYDIRWAVLVLNLAVCCAAALLLAALLAWATRLKRPTRAYAVVAALVVVIAFSVSVGFSRSYWGYWFARPTLVADVAALAGVRAIVPVETVDDDSGHRTVIVDRDFSVASWLKYAEEDPEDGFLGSRIPATLAASNFSPTSDTTTLAGLPDIYALVKDTGILAAHEEDYTGSDLLTGVVVDAFDASGRRLLILGLSGGMVSNDHFPYYELLFAGAADGAGWRCIRMHRFFYDVAGIEGFEWYVAWPFLSVAGVAAAFVAFTIAVAGWRVARARRRAARDPGTQVSGASA